MIGDLQARDEGRLARLLGFRLLVAIIIAGRDLCHGSGAPDHHHVLLAAGGHQGLLQAFRQHQYGGEDEDHQDHPQGGEQGGQFARPFPRPDGASPVRSTDEGFGWS